MTRNLLYSTIQFLVKTNIDQINAGNATAQFIINNAKDFGFASKDRKKLMLQAQRISNMINAGKKASVPPMQTK